MYSLQKKIISYIRRQRHDDIGQTYFSGAINVVDAEDRTETVEKNFSERRHQLSRSHQHVHT